MSDKNFEVLIRYEWDMLTCPPCGMHTKKIQHPDGRVEEYEWPGSPGVTATGINGEYLVPSCKHRKGNI